MYLAFITSVLGLLVAFYTVLKIRTRLTAGFAIILFLYTVNYIVRLVACIVGKGGMFGKINVIVTTFGISTIDIIMFLVVL